MIAILGAGHAGRAMAGDLALRGAPVALWNRTAANIAVLRARGGVELEGEVEGFGRVSLITDDLEAALAAPVWSSSTSPPSPIGNWRSAAPPTCATARSWC